MSEGSKKSRLSTYQEQSGDDDSVFLQFPDLNGAGYMVALLREAGLNMSNGMGAVPLSWQEIEAWLRATELELSIWEKLTIREMSEVYVTEMVKSTGKHCVAPYTPTPMPNQIDRPAVASKLLNVLRGFKRKAS